MGATALSGALSLAFWAVAARVLPAEEVGRDGAVVTALIALSGACQLNLYALLPRFLPGERGGAARLVRIAFAVSGAAAAVVTTAFVLVAPALAEDLEVLHDEPLLAVLAVCGVVGYTVLFVQDAALAAVRRAGWLPVEQLVYNIGRLAILGAAAVAAIEHGILLAWVLPLAIVLPVGARILFAHALPAHAARPVEGSSPARALARGALARFLVADSAGFVVRQIALGVMPVVVLAVVGSGDAAAFTVPFALVVAFDLLFLGAATSLTVEGSQHGARLDELVRVLVRRFLVPMLVVVAGLVAAAPLVMRVFGEQYADDGAGALRLLLLGSAVRAVMVLAEVLQRLRGDARPVLASSVVALAAALVLTPVLVDAHGVTGGGAAWLGAHVLAALVLLPAGRRAMVEASRA